jgi:GNAT superfamily N-acetyltransferase
MNKENFTLRRIKEEELPLFRNFAPPDWNINLENIYRTHFHQNGYEGFIALSGDEPAGTGMILFHHGVAWLGAIIVDEKYRNKGLGTTITKHLIERSENLGAESVILIASEIGYPLYAKLGFETELNYLVYKTENALEGIPDKVISPVEERDYNQILAMDKQVTSEERSERIISFLKTGFKYSADKIRGYYLPDFGRGLVVAMDKSAGTALLNLKLIREKQPVVLPETNKEGIEFLESSGFKQTKKMPRMFLGKKLSWKSECIWSRSSGYLG